MASADFSNHFSEKNIPFGVASSAAYKEPQAVTRLGNTVIFLQDLVNELFKDVEGLAAGVLSQPTLNAFAALPKTVHQNVRSRVQSAYENNGLDCFPASSKEDINAVTMHLPMEIKDFAGKHHILSLPFTSQSLTFNRLLLLPRPRHKRRSYCRQQPQSTTRILPLSCRLPRSH